MNGPISLLLIDHDLLSFVILCAMLIVALTFHEFAHAFAADRLGDPTPSLQGRLSLNPLVHLDPIGTALLLIAGFGWAKPVMFDPYNLRNPRKDTTLIALAGPAANLILAILAAVIYHTVPFGSVIFIHSILYLFIQFNVVLAVFNLIPIHPLDGFKIVAGLLPKQYYQDWMSLSTYGMIFLILLVFPIFTPVAPLSTILTPAVRFIVGILVGGRGGIL